MQPKLPVELQALLSHFLFHISSLTLEQSWFNHRNRMHGR
jgi:hypothetical protein